MRSSKPKMPKTEWIKFVEIGDTKEKSFTISIPSKFYLNFCLRPKAKDLVITRVVVVVVLGFFV